MERLGDEPSELPNGWIASLRTYPRAVELLLAHGADPSARTRIDEQTTPLEEAERLHLSEIVEILKKA